MQLLQRSVIVALAAAWNINHADMNKTENLLRPIRLDSQSTRIARVGEGATGIVYRLEKSSNMVENTADTTAYVLKVPKKTANGKSTIEKLIYECHVLDELNIKKVTGVRTCLGLFPIAIDSDFISPESDTGIVLYPFIPSNISSIEELQDSDVLIKGKLIMQLLRSSIQIIFAKYAIADLQYLVDMKTESLVIIDLTEAHPISSLKYPTFADLAAIRSFWNEVWTNIPQSEFYVSMSETVISQEISNSMKTYLQIS